ncbi:hypothetical protein CesoFtcFv8_019673 [Champsocephalus esox]|uniref:Uncharacterized protein n=1 Tax=Champsocephalus esox TaxID=159716 RepID=A0AAN8BF33_9TELE|nr:hypothetical protein CesoFtcFv8_019673 [Champsocephalus esox]
MRTCVTVTSQAAISAHLHLAGLDHPSSSSCSPESESSVADGVSLSRPLLQEGASNQLSERMLGELAGNQVRRGK